MKRNILTVMIIILLFTSYGFQQKTNTGKAKVVNTTDAPKPIGTYSQAILAGGTLYLSGQIAIDPATGKMDTADIVTQTKRIMGNLQAVLKSGNMDFSNVVKTTIFMRDLNNFPKVNEIYGQYFKTNPPARETVKVAGLPKNAGLEISMVAYK